MSSRRLAVATLVVGLALGLSACAPDVDTEWMPEQWPASIVSVGEVPEPIDAASVAVFAQRVRNDAVGVQARFSVPHGQSALGDRVREIVRGAASAQASSAGGTYTPQAAAPGAGMGSRDCVRGSTFSDTDGALAADDAAADDALPADGAFSAERVLADPALGPNGGTGTAVVCDIVVASGGYLGERVRVVTGSAGAATSDITTVVYSDLATGEVVSGDGLWAPEAADELWRDVLEALRREAGSLSLAPVGEPTDDQRARITAALASTGVAPDGSLVFTLAPGFEAPELAALGVPATTGPTAISVPVAALTSLASPFGSGMSAAVAASTPYSGPAQIAAGFESVDCALVPCAAITYDDGPSPLTPTLLDTLRDTHSAATFFMLGNAATGAPDTVRRAAAEGHDIGVHTWNHPQLPKLDDASIRSQIGDTRALLQSLTGQSVAMFRPPYGEYNRRVLDVAGLPAFIWTIDTRDWAGPADDVLLASGINEVKPGGIVLFHDTHERTVRLAPDIIAGLRDRGYTLVTLTQLFGGTLPTSGAWSAAP